MKKMSMFLLAAPVALAGFAVPAAAQEDVTVIVRYDDLNLASAPGRERLTTRVRKAVEQVCESRPNYWQTLQQRAQAMKCEAAAQKNADVQLANLLGANGSQFAGNRPMVVTAP